jgi:hypothetical protein
MVGVERSLHRLDKGDCMKKVNEVVKAMQNNPLGEAFLLMAIESYCRNVINDDSDWGKSFIAKDAWVGIAKENLTLLEQGRE